MAGYKMLQRPIFSPRFARITVILALFATFLALILGGKSAGFAATSALFLLLALWLFIMHHLSGLSVPAGPARKVAGWLMLGFGLFAALQLLPLPYALWSALTPSDLARNMLEATGLDHGWRPLTLDWVASISALVAVALPFCLFWVVASLGLRDRYYVALLLVVLALTSTVLGVLQFSGGDALHFYESAHNLYATGFFSNRNHHADFVLIGALIASALLRMVRDEKRDILSRNTRASMKYRDAYHILVATSFAGGFLLLVTALSLFAAASRTGLAMAVPVFICCIALIWGSGRSWKPVSLAVLAMIAATAVFALARPELFMIALERFDSEGDLRFTIWPVIVRLIGDYMPLGSGLGTFIPVFMTAQPLEMLDSRYVNNAHNDYLEVALEMGLPGLLLMAGFMVFFAMLIWRALRQAAGEKLAALHFACIASVVVLLLHSVTDYSLRTDTLGATMAIVLALLMPLPARDASLLVMRTARGRPRGSRKMREKVPV